MQRYRDKLDEWAQRYKGISLILKLTDVIASEQGGDAAGQFLVEALANKPSVKGLDRLIELKAAGNLDTESSDDILRAVTTRLLTRQPQLSLPSLRVQRPDSSLVVSQLQELEHDEENSGGPGRVAREPVWAAPKKWPTCS